MRSVSVGIDVDIDDFLSSCSSKDIKYLIECLVEDGHIDRLNLSLLNKSHKSSNLINDDRWNDAIKKLLENRHQLNSEDEATVFEISEKIVI